AIARARACGRSARRGGQSCTARPTGRSYRGWSAPARPLRGPVRARTAPLPRGPPLPCGRRTERCGRREEARSKVRTLRRQAALAFRADRHRRTARIPPAPRPSRTTLAGSGTTVFWPKMYVTVIVTPACVVTNPEPLPVLLVNTEVPCAQNGKEI